MDENLNLDPLSLPPTETGVLSTIRGLYGQTSPERGKVRPRSGDKRQTVRGDSGPPLQNWASNQHDPANDEAERILEVTQELANLKKRLERSSEHERKLRATVSHLENCLENRDKELQEVAQFMRGSDGAIAPSDTDRLAEKKLREQYKQVANVRKLIKQKDEEIAELQRHSKLSMLKEVQREAAEYMVEIERLRLLLRVKGLDNEEANRFGPLMKVPSEPATVASEYQLNEPRFTKYRDKISPQKPHQTKASQLRQKPRKQKAAPKKRSNQDEEEEGVVYFHVSTANQEIPYTAGPPSGAPRLSTMMVPMVSPDADSDALLRPKPPRRFENPYMPMMVPVERTERLAKNARLRHLQAREREVAEKTRRLQAEARVFQNAKEKWAKKKKKQAKVTKKMVNARLKELDDDFEKEQQKRADKRRFQEIMTSEEGYVAAQLIQKVFRGYYTRKLVQEAKEYMISMGQTPGGLADKGEPDAPSAEELLEELQNDLDEKGYEVQDLQERCQEYEEEIANLTKRCEDLEQANAALGQEIEDTKYQAENDAEEKLEPLHQRILDLEKQIALKDERIDALNRTNLELLQPNDNDGDVVGNLKSKIIDLNIQLENMSKLENENYELKQKLMSTNRTRTISQGSLPNDFGEDSIRIPPNRRQHSSQAKRYDDQKIKEDEPHQTQNDESTQVMKGALENVENTNKENPKDAIKPEDSTQDVVPSEMPRVEGSHEMSREESEGEVDGKDQVDNNDLGNASDGSKNKRDIIPDACTGTQQSKDETKDEAVENSVGDLQPSEIPRTVEDENDESEGENSGDDMQPSEMPRPVENENDESEREETSADEEEEDENDDEESLAW
mmetsp:Transcript_5860/g.8044  ORF Transcript_5860/g.8044 Transcript_5860/m.8044 type:complete len:848 (+) Transcript_5860:217-2760(+)